MTGLIAELGVKALRGQVAKRLERAVAKKTAESLAAREAETLAAREAAKTPARKAAKSPAIIRARTGTPAAIAKDAMAEAAKPSKGSPSFAEWRAKNPENGLVYDTSQLSRVPDVAQFDLARVNPPRGPSARMTDALDDPRVTRGINRTVRRGIEGGGLEWYNTEPVLEVLRKVSNDPDADYARLMDMMSATSPRARVTDNIRTGSLYNYLWKNGLPIGEKPPKGYGSIAQNLHRDNVLGLIEDGGWKVFQNPKPASFSQNLQGNFRPTTIDTHNFRLPGILSKDPRFLETNIAEKFSNTDPEGGLALLMRQYPNLPEDYAASLVRSEANGKFDKKTGNALFDHRVTYKPREWHDRGYLSMEDALEDPGVWTAKPKDNEYGYYERWQQRQAKRLGIAPAQYQAAMWLGGGDTTGLGSAAEPFLATLEARTRYTADRLGLSPEVVRDLMVKGDVPLLAEGGLVEKPDYDYEGAKRAGVKADARGHMPDTYKLPNHMTFSDDSVYSKPGHEGGKWRQGTDGRWGFWASPYNLTQHSVPEMQSYFAQVEPDSFAVYPSDYRIK